MAIVFFSMFGHLRFGSFYPAVLALCFFIGLFWNGNRAFISNSDVILDGLYL